MVKKTFDKKTNICKVTFMLSPDVQAKTAFLCGDFNGWDQAANPMKKQKDGSFKASLELETGRQYAFRYFLDGDRWENDWEADGYAANEYGGENSVINL